MFKRHQDVADMSYILKKTKYHFALIQTIPLAYTNTSSEFIAVRYDTANHSSSSSRQSLLYMSDVTLPVVHLATVPGSKLAAVRVRACEGEQSPTVLQQ